VLSGCEDSKNLVNCKVKSLNLSNLAQVISNTNSPAGASATNARHGSYISPIDNSEQIIGVANTTQLNWRVVVDEAKSEFTAPLNFLALRTLLSVLIISSLAVMGGILLARVITQPLGKLSQVAQAIQNGGTPHPEELTEVMQQGDEVGHLALVFNGMLDSLAARVSELHAINVVARKISSSFNIGTTLTLVLNSVRSVVPYDRALLMLYDPETERFCTRATGDGRGFYLNRVWNELDTPAYHSKNEGYLQRFFANRKNETLRVLEPDLDQAAEVAQTYEVEWGDFEARSYLGAPLMFKDDVIGVIELASAQAESFNADHARVLELIAGQAAIALRNALDVEQREAELRRQIDALRVEVDEGKKLKNVEEIVGSDFFQELSSKADKIRQRRQEERDEAAAADASEKDKPGSEISGEN
jgi:GAF domain-containing protein/HAMP domain-containing protein